MSTPQYLRKVSLIIGSETIEDATFAEPKQSNALEFSQLKIEFQIRRGDTETPNSADIRIYNLSDETSQKIEKEFSKIVLQAGYEGNYGLIFYGTLKQVRRGRATNQVDTFIDILAADGDSAYNFAYLNSTVAAGSTPQDVFVQISRVFDEKGVAQGYVPDMKGYQLPRGKVLFGEAKDELRCTALNSGSDWYIDDGKVNIVPQSAYLTGDVPVINADSGMIGLPEQTINGIKLVTLLNPNIKIGHLVKLDNYAIQKAKASLSVSGEVNNYQTQIFGALNTDGFYKVILAEHIGDTRGNDWYTELTCLSADLSGIQTQEQARRVGVGIDDGRIKPFG